MDVPIRPGNWPEEDVCWICLESARIDEPLLAPCACPRKVHKKCLARWQLHSAGKDEEKTCRFCAKRLPDWRPILTPDHLKPATPVVSVHYNGVCYRLRVKPGPEGYDLFRKQLQRITGMPLLECMQITFQCKSPDTAQELCFKGISAFDAAMHCASISAAERLVHHHPGDRQILSESGANGSAVPGPAQNDRSVPATEVQGSLSGAQARQERIEINTTQSGTSNSREPNSGRQRTVRRSDSACIILPTSSNAETSNSSSPASGPKESVRFSRVREFIKSWFRE